MDRCQTPGLHVKWPIVLDINLKRNTTNSDRQLCDVCFRVIDWQQGYGIGWYIKPYMPCLLTRATVLHPVDIQVITVFILLRRHWLVRLFVFYRVTRYIVFLP